VEGHVKVTNSIQEHKTGPFNTKTDVSNKFVPEGFEKGPMTPLYNYN